MISSAARFVVEGTLNFLHRWRGRTWQNPCASIWNREWRSALSALYCPWRLVLCVLCVLRALLFL